MALLDLYKRYMYGKRPSMMLDGSEQDYLDGKNLGITNVTEGTKGLFGQGGQSGDGLLNTFTKPETDGLFNALSNPFYTIGGSAVLKGMQGQNISKAIMPSIKEGLSLSESSKKIQAAKKKQDFIKKYADQVPESDKQMFLAFPERYVDAMLKTRLSTPTLSKEALAVVNKLKGLSGDNFDAAFKKLSQVEKDIYASYVKKASAMNIPNIIGAKTKADTAAAKNANKLPIADNGLVDVSKLQDGLIYNVGGQAERWNKEKGKFEKVK